MSIPFSSQISASTDVMLRQVGEESVLLNLKTEQYLGFDDISTRMWQVLTGGGSIQLAYETLLSEFDVDPEQLRKDLEDFVQQLMQLSLVGQKQL